MNQPAATPQPPHQEPQEVPIGQILSIFWRGRWVILACAVVATVIGYWQAQQRGTIYRASARVYVDKKGRNPLGADALGLGMGARNYANTQAEVIASSEVFHKALEGFTPYFPDAEIFGQESVRSLWLRRNLSVKVGRDDEIITVTLESRFKDEACELVNWIVKSYRSFQESQKQKSALELLKLLQEDEKRFTLAFDAALKAQREYLKDHPGAGSEGSSVFKEQWKAQALELTEAERELLAAQQALHEARGLKDNPTMLREFMPGMSDRSMYSMQNSPRVMALENDIQQLERQRLGVLARGAAMDHPDLKLIDAELEKQRKKLETNHLDFAEWYVKNLEGRVAAAQDKRDAVAKRVKDSQDLLNERDQQDFEYKNLQATVDRNRNALDKVFEGIQKINPEGDDVNLVSVLDWASPESVEVASGKTMRIAAALLLGLFLGAGLAWLRGIMDQRIRNAEEVRTGLRLPILAILPRAKKIGSEQITVFARWGADAHYAEAARSLRTAVYFGMAQGEGNRVQVTSPDAGDGKTTIAANLALAMAKAGQRTLLIDADLRKPRQAERFGLTNETGLSNVLASEMHPQEAIQHTEIKELDVLTSGPVPSNPAEILNSAKFARVLDELAGKYDRVIIDSPPILPVADARIIASKCSTTVLTLRVDKSTRKRAAAARDAILGANAKILGVALNDMPSGIGYGYGYGYGYGKYGYGYGYGKYGDDAGTNGPREPGAEGESRAARQTKRKETT